MALQMKKPKKKKLKPKANNKLLKRDNIIKNLYGVCGRNKYETLRDEAEENTIQSVYESLSVAIEESSVQKLPKTTRNPKPP